MYPLLWSRYFREELQQRIWGRGSSWEDPHRVLLSYSSGSFFFFFSFFGFFFPLPFLIVEKGIVCRWRRHGWSIQGTCPSLGIMPGSLGGTGKKSKLCIFCAILGVFQLMIHFHRVKKKRRLENGIGRQKQQPDADLAHVPWPNRPMACPEHSAFHQDNLSPVSGGNRE